MIAKTNPPCPHCGAENNDKVVGIGQRVFECGTPTWRVGNPRTNSCYERREKQLLSKIEEFKAALSKISNYPYEPIWADSSADSADEMVTIAERALKGLPLEGDEE